MRAHLPWGKHAKETLCSTRRAIQGQERSGEEEAPGSGATVTKKQATASSSYNFLFYKLDLL